MAEGELVENHEAIERECCKLKANRSEPVDRGNGLVTVQCTVCNATHWLLTLDPGDLRQEGADIGEKA